MGHRKWLKVFKVLITFILLFPWNTACCQERKIVFNSYCDSISDYLNKRFQLPEYFATNEFEGVAQVKFYINKSGSIDTFQIITSPDISIKHELDRVFTNMPQWKSWPIIDSITVFNFYISIKGRYPIEINNKIKPKVFKEENGIVDYDTMYVYYKKYSLERDSLLAVYNLQPTIFQIKVFENENQLSPYNGFKIILHIDSQLIDYEIIDFNRIAIDYNLKQSGKNLNFIIKVGDNYLLNELLLNESVKDGFDVIVVKLDNPSKFYKSLKSKLKKGENIDQKELFDFLLLNDSDTTRKLQRYRRIAILAKIASNKVNGNIQLISIFTNEKN